MDQLRAGRGRIASTSLATLGGETVGHGIGQRLEPGRRVRAWSGSFRSIGGAGSGARSCESILDIHLAAGRRSVASHAEDDGAMAFADASRVRRGRSPGRAGPRPSPRTSRPAAVPRRRVHDGRRRPRPAPARLPARPAGLRGPRARDRTGQVSLDEWLRDEATLPGGSMVALADGEVVGYAGLIAWNDDETRAENGLTVVDRAWRGQGPRDRAQAPPAGLGVRQRPARAGDLDPGRQRRHAARQHRASAT